MKSAVLTLICTFAFATALLAQCNPFFNYSEGDEFEYEMRDKKGKAEGRQVTKVSKVEDTDEGTVFTMDITYFDKKDDEVYAASTQAVCEGNTVKMDMDRFMQSMGAMQQSGVELSIDGDMLALPASLSVGDELPEATFVMTMKMGDSGMNAGMDNQVKIHNRKVTAEEQVTTEAGTFDCYKITYDQTVTMKIMGMERKNNFQGAEWFSKDAGMIKSESYNDKGKLTGSMVLTRFE